MDNKKYSNLYTIAIFRLHFDGTPGGRYYVDAQGKEYEIKLVDAKSRKIYLKNGKVIDVGKEDPSAVIFMKYYGDYWDANQDKYHGEKERFIDHAPRMCFSLEAYEKQWYSVYIDKEFTEWRTDLETGIVSYVKRILKNGSLMIVQSDSLQEEDSIKDYALVCIDYPFNNTSHKNFYVTSEDQIPVIKVDANERKIYLLSAAIINVGNKEPSVHIFMEKYGMKWDKIRNKQNENMFAPKMYFSLKSFEKGWYRFYNRRLFTMSHIEMEYRKKQAGIFSKHFGPKNEEIKKITITDLFSFDTNKNISVDMIMSSLEPAENISVDKIILIEKVLEIINKNK